MIDLERLAVACNKLGIEARVRPGKLSFSLPMLREKDVPICSVSLYALSV